MHFLLKINSVGLLLRTGYKPLQQVAKRIEEKRLMEYKPQSTVNAVSFKEKNGILINLTINGLLFDNSIKNRFFLTKDFDVVKIVKFSVKDGQKCIIGSRLSNKYRTNLFDAPIESSKLHTYKYTRLFAEQETTFEISEILFKMFIMKVNDMNDYVFSPLYNELQNV